MGAEAASRPLLAGDPVERLGQLLELRRELFKSADAVVDTELYDFEQTAQRTAELASAFLQHQRE